MRSRIILLLTAVVLACSEDGNSSTETPVPHPVDAVGVASWAPANITIKAGEVVTFRNSSSSTAHNVQFDGGVAGAPANVANFTDASKAVTFTTPGTYPYHCGIHPAMQGEVVVTQ